MYAIQCGEFNDIVAWSKDGLSFCINNTDAFEKAVLPVVFKPAKWESFARKIARWGFKKIRLTGAYAEKGAGYIHPQFRRGDFALSSLMSCNGSSNDDRSNTEEHQVVSILASLSTSTEASNKPQRDRVVSDADCFIQPRLFQHHLTRMCDENELINATRMVSNPNLRQQTRKQEHAVPSVFHQLRRDPPQDDVGMMQRPFQRNLLSEASKRIPFPSRLPMNYFSPAPASFAGHRRAPQHAPLPTPDDLKSRALMQALRQRQELIKKRKMVIDVLFEESHSRPRYMRRFSGQEGRSKFSIREMDNNRFDSMRNRDQIVQEARAVLDRAIQEF